MGVLALALALAVSAGTSRPPTGVSGTPRADRTGAAGIRSAAGRPVRGGARAAGPPPRADSRAKADAALDVAIPNAGFEDGFVPAPHGLVGVGWQEWVFYEGGFISYQPSTAPSPVHSGSYAQAIMAENSDVVLCQTVAGLTPGQEYILSTWLFSDWPVDCLLGYEPYGGPPPAIVNWGPAAAPPGTWAKAEMVLSAESSLATVALRIWASVPLPVVNDDWSLRTYVPPLCSFTMSPSPAATEQEVVLDSTSTDPDGVIASWDWGFGDGGTASGQSTTHAYAASGSYTVTLTVTDDDGFSASCSDVISVVGTVVSRVFPYGWNMMSLPLEPVVPDPEVVFAGIPISGNLHRYSHDPPQGYVTYYDFNPAPFGDMTSGDGYWFYCLEPEGCEVRYAGYDRTSSFVVALPTSGWYMIGASDVDFHFDDILVSSALEVLPFPLAANVWVQDPLIGYDNAGGQYFAAGILPTDDDHYLRTWNGCWTYSFEDGLGAILNKPPVADAGPDLTTVRGMINIFDGMDSYDPDGDIVSYSWDFGDGWTDIGPIAMHRYSIMSDVYPVTLTVTDDMGNTATDELAIYVQEHTYLLDIHYDNGALSLNGAALTTGFVPDRLIQPEAGYRADVLSDTGSVLYSFRFDIPLYLMYDDPMEEPADELAGGLIEFEETDVVLVIPYFSNAEEVRIYDAGDALKLTVDLSGVETLIGVKVGTPANCQTLRRSGASKYAHDIVFLGDNYSAAEMAILANNVGTHQNRLLSVAPFSTNAGVINVHYMQVASNPGAADNLGCFYGAGGNPNLIACNTLRVIATGTQCPADEIIVIVKGTQYGGGGWRGFGGVNSYAMSYAGQDPNFVARNAGQYVTVHESGHSFGNLHDEYTYQPPGPTGAIPDGPNCDNAAGCPRWAGTPGTACSANCSYTNWNKPTLNTCLMQGYTYNPFAYCPVCSNQLGLLLGQYWADTAPTVALVSPQDNLKTNINNVTFSCNVTDDFGLTSVSLYGDFSGTWQLDQTQAVAGTLAAVVFNKTGLPDGTYQWNCEATDTVPQTAFAPNNFSLTIDTVPPSPVTNLRSPSQTATSILWAWTNPPDADFDHVEVWIDGQYQTDVVAPGNQYLAQGLTPNTWYEIETRTVDDAGNVNTNWVTLQTKTCVIPVDDLVITEDTTVCPGTYNVVDVAGDGVIIIGADDVTLDLNGAQIVGDGTGYGIRSAMSGVTIKNAAVSSYYYAINLAGAADNLVRDCTVSYNNEGIHLDGSTGNTIRHNTALNNGNGIFVTGVLNSGNTVDDNTVTNSTANGIGMDGAGPNNVITSNTITTAGVRGIDLGWGSDALVEDNTITFAARGIEIYGFSGTTIIRDNTVTDSTGYALLTWLGVDGLTVEGNTFERCGGDVIYLSDTHNSTFRTNTIASAGADRYGVHFDPTAGYGSYNNVFYDNYISNNHNVSDPWGNIWNTSYCPSGPNIMGGPCIGGNYWSDYTGFDLNGDGIGDWNIPYNTGIATGGDYYPLVPWP